MSLWASLHRSVRSRTPPPQVGNFAKHGRCRNRPEIGHATLDNSHRWRGRFVPCRSFRCRGPAEIWPGRGTGRNRGDDVRRLSTFVQTPPPTACSTRVSSAASRCALGTATAGQHAATRSERPSTSDEPAVPTQCVPRADRSDILARMPPLILPTSCCLRMERAVLDLRL